MNVPKTTPSAAWAPFSGETDSSSTWLDWRPWLARLRRQAVLVFGLPLLVGLGYRWFGPSPAVTYQARLAVAVDIPRSAIVVGSDEGTAAKIGEALIDDLSRMIGGDVFAAAVAKHLPPAVSVQRGEIASALAATDRHRITDITVTRQAPADLTPEREQQLRDDLLAIAQAVVKELNTNGAAWFARLGEDAVILTVVDSPKVTVLPPSLRQRLDFPLRVLLATLIGLGLAALREVTDVTIRTAQVAREVVAAPVLGCIPRRRRERTGAGAA